MPSCSGIGHRKPRVAARPGSLFQSPLSSRLTTPDRIKLPCRATLNASAINGTSLPAFQAGSGPELGQQFSTHLSQIHSIYDVSEGLETPIQLIYLLTLLGFLAAGAYLVVRQLLVRRELDEAAKSLGERIRTDEATCEDYFELGVILTRKKLFTQATKNLEKAKKIWDGEENELAQVHNALGFCYFNMEKVRCSHVLPSALIVCMMSELASLCKPADLHPQAITLIERMLAMRIFEVYAWASKD